MRNIFLVAGLGLLASGVVGQAAPVVTSSLPLNVQSGTFDNPTKSFVVVFERLVTGNNAPWLQLHFQGATLDGASYLEIASLRDGGVQRLDADAFADWQNHSAYFNGDAVYLRLVAGPRTRGNQVHADGVLVPVQAPPPPTICGGADDRVLSTDKRVARMMPVGCTGWLINPNSGMVTAGHCAGSSLGVAQFNVPPSSSNGSLNNPPPQDQYPVLSRTVQRVSGGIGNDWSVYEVAKNSNTGLTPGAAQGTFFRLGFFKPAVGATIRITGHGTASGNRNQAQTTHAGPLRRNSGTALCYHTDTTGGNSGSPVIDEATGRAVGVHTHGGCGSSSSSCNSGTSTTLSAFFRALAPFASRDRDGRFAPPAPPATAWTFGAGCPGSSGLEPVLGTSVPRVGQPFDIDLAQAPASGNALLLLGQGGHQWNGQPLPLSLSSMGMPGCHLFVAPQTAVAVSTDAQGNARVTVPVPPSSSLLGEVLLFQWQVSDPTANQAGFVFSPGGYALFGN